MLTESGHFFVCVAGHELTPPPPPLKGPSWTRTVGQSSASGLQTLTPMVNLEPGGRRLVAELV